jgi:hypothetical protein
MMRKRNGKLMMINGSIVEEVIEKVGDAFHLLIIDK